jgi:hypothetical protein
VLSPFALAFQAVVKYREVTIPYAHSLKFFSFLFSYQIFALLISLTAIVEVTNGLYIVE